MNVKCEWEKVCTLWIIRMNNETCVSMMRSFTDFVENLSHLHDESLPPIEPQLVVLVTEKQITSSTIKHRSHDSHLPQAKRRPLSVSIIVPSSPHFTLQITSAIFDPGLCTNTSTGWFLWVRVCVCVCVWVSVCECVSNTGTNGPEESVLYIVRCPYRGVPLYLLFCE